MIFLHWTFLNININGIECTILLPIMFNPLVLKWLNSTAVPPGRWDTVEFHRIGSKWHFITGLSSLVTRHSSLVTRHSSVLTWHSSLILRKEKIDFNWTIFWTKKEELQNNTVEYHRIGTKCMFYYRPLVTNCKLSGWS